MGAPGGNEPILETITFRFHIIFRECSICNKFATLNNFSKNDNHQQTADRSKISVASCQEANPSPTHMAVAKKWQVESDSRDTVDKHLRGLVRSWEER